PGTYTVRPVVPPDLVPLTPGSAGYRVTVRVGTNTGGWDFGNVRHDTNEVSAYVSGLYGTLLDRPPDAPGLAAWVSIIQAGVPRDQVALAIWQSPEHRGLEVDRYYALYLHRAADPGGRSAWVSYFQSGASEIDVQQAFILSGEYQAAHVTDASFITAL